MGFRNPARFCCRSTKVFALRYENQLLDLRGIEAAIFDLDGTLVESEPVWAEAKRYVANRENVEVSEQVLMAYVGRSVADFVNEIIAPTNAPSITRDIVERALSHYDNNVDEIPGASDLIKEFSRNGFATAICSSAPERAIQKCMQLLNIELCINTVVSTEFLAKGKPNKFPYVETLRRLEIPSEKAVVFEDASAGLASAISAGIKTICVGSSVNSRKFDCELYARSIGDISLVASPR